MSSCTLQPFPNAVIAFHQLSILISLILSELSAEVALFLWLEDQRHVKAAIARTHALTVTDTNL